MVEKINCGKLVDRSDLSGTEVKDWLAWAVCELTSQIDSKTFSEQLKKSKLIEIEVSVNGVPVKFSELIKQLRKSFMGNVSEEAAKLVEAQISECQTRLARAVNDFEKSLSQGNSFTCVHCGKQSLSSGKAASA